MVDRPFEVHEVPRRCSCGHEWVGRSFTPIAEGEQLPRCGICDECNDRDEAHLRELTRRAPALGQPMPKSKPNAVKFPRDPDDASAGVHWWND